ncbi:MAG: S24 family peptidase, partial [Clostridia bacterium]
RCDSANNGDIVVALVNGTENTLKYFYEENGKVRLEPANVEYDTIYPKTLDIQGKLVGLIKLF